jgi:hypothetical protein
LPLIFEIASIADHIGGRVSLADIFERSPFRRARRVKPVLDRSFGGNTAPDAALTVGGLRESQIDMTSYFGLPAWRR